MINLKALLIFGLTALLVVTLGYDFLKPAFEIGLSPEDREFILIYKLLGPNPLSKIFQVWAERGAYTTVPIYYIGTVQSIVGFNYQLIQSIGFLFRTLAILSIFPLTMLVFKNSWLAVLTTIVFAFSYTTTGALETGVEPSEYLGMLMMNIFLVAYYFLNTKFLLNFRWLIATSFLLFAAVMTSAMRVYPLLFLLPLVEMFLWILNHKKYQFKYLLIKLFVLYLPFLVLNYYFPVSTSGHFSLPSIVYRILEGNWQLVLTPFHGLGFMIPIRKYYGYLGIIDLSSFTDYLGFLLGGPLFVFGSVSIIISLISTKRWLFFFFRVFFLNLGLEIFTYWIVQQRLFAPSELRLNFDTPRLYPILFGLFLFSLMVNFLIDWLRTGKKNNFLLALWAGLFVALFFITLTYMFASLGLSFGGAQDHYLLIPTFGFSIFISGILLLLYEKLSAIRLKFIGGITVMVLLAFFYILNKEITHNYFIGANFNGRAAAGQELLQAKIRGKFKDYDYSKPAIVYFDTSDIPYGYGPFYSEGLLTPFPILMYSQGEKVISGCVGVIYEDRQMSKLKKAIRIIDNQQVIVYHTVCVENSKINVRDVIYKPENLYAFKIQDGDFIDIKDQLLDELNFR